MWSRDHGLETRVHSSSFCPGLGLGPETWSPRSRSWFRDLKRSWQQHCSNPTKLLSDPHWPDSRLNVRTYAITSSVGIPAVVVAGSTAHRSCHFSVSVAVTTTVLTAPIPVVTGDGHGWVCICSRLYRMVVYLPEDCRPSRYTNRAQSTAVYWSTSVIKITEVTVQCIHWAD